MMHTNEIKSFIQIMYSEYWYLSSNDTFVFLGSKARLLLIYGLSERPDKWMPNWFGESKVRTH